MSSYDKGSKDPQSENIVDRFVDDDGQKLEVTKHAVNQWKKRSSEEKTHYPLETAWDEAVSVGMEGAGKSRLFCPEDLVLISNGSRIRTAKKIHRQNLNTDHLKECADCGYLTDPSRFNCPWCAGGDTTAEFIGACSAIVDESCYDCGANATHSLFEFFDGVIEARASCNTCGEPSDARYDTEWAHEITDAELDVLQGGEGE